LVTEASLKASNLARLLSPETVAVVGANEALGMSNNAVIPMIEAGRQVALVNPRRDSLYGQSVFPDLTAVGEPIDAVLSLVNSERSISVLEEAAAMGCGGVIIAAAGFVEADDEGAALQRRLEQIAETTGVAVIGPNCAGIRNVPLGANLFTGGRLDLPVAGTDTVGGVSIVSQSGFLVRSAFAAARERALGVSIVVSSGNEAVCDLADHVVALTADPNTSVICLVIETVRRPREFFEAVAAARESGKPVIAVKLGRSDRAREIMQSHTGAIADESWVYDVAFREHGVLAARDIDDLLDRAQLFVQLPRIRHRRIDRIGMISTSGGVAAIATDIAADVGAPLPPLTELEDWVRERVPGDTINPLDLTGFVMTKADLMQEVFEKYASSVEALVLGWWTGDADEGWSKMLLEPFASVAERSDVPFIVSPVESTGVGDWVSEWRPRDLVFTRGIESTYRSIDAMTQFVSAEIRPAVESSAVEQSTAPDFVQSDAGPIVPFAAAMEMLVFAGIAVAPYVVLDEGEVEPSVVNRADVAALGDSLVVKLADVPHRTELDAVRVGVAPSELVGAVTELRSIAHKNAVPETVVVQAMVAGHSEAFAGLQCGTKLGPVALLGVGGVLVEVSNRVAGRFLPIDDATAIDLANEVVAPVSELRGQRDWPQDRLAGVVRSLDLLWARNASWLDAADINPLIVSEDGVVAVDVLLIGRDGASD
jgi:acyl-CoA synthetase (NDP forming)